MLYCVNVHTRHNIEFTEGKHLLYTTVNQAVNDLLENNTMDEQVVLESLANLFYTNNYADLSIKPENHRSFQHYKSLAEEYFTYE